jgi:hypothetical protein
MHLLACRYIDFLSIARATSVLCNDTHEYECSGTNTFEKYMIHYIFCLIK